MIAQKHMSYLGKNNGIVLHSNMAKFLLLIEPVPRLICPLRYFKVLC